LRKKKEAVEILSTDEGSVGEDSTDFHSSEESEFGEYNTEEQGNTNNEKEVRRLGKQKPPRQSTPMRKVSTSNPILHWITRRE
jgi:hypothetical protein